MCKPFEMVSENKLFISFTLLILFAGFGNVLSGQRVTDRRVQVENREARALLKNARNHRKQGRYSEAAATYLKLLKTHPYAALQENDRRYVGVHAIVRQHISSMDREARRAVRTLFRKESSRRFERAKNNGDMDAIRTIASVYWMTEPGRKAILQLARRAYKRGHLKTAIYWWTQHLKSSPGKKPSRLTNVRLQHALALSPDDMRFHELKQQREQKLKSSQHYEIRKNRHRSSKPSTENLKRDWPRPGGNNTGTGRVYSLLESYTVPDQKTSGRQLIGLWTEPATGSGSTARSSGNGLSTHAPHSSTDMETGPVDELLNTEADYTFSPLQPIVYRDKILINDGSHIFAYALQAQVFESWKDPRSRLLWTYPDVTTKLDRNRVKSLYSGKEGYRIRSLAGYNGSLYAHVRNRLHKINLSTGRSLFVARPPKVKGEYLSFNGTPVVTEHGVFVPFIRKTVGGRGQMYIARYKHNTGKRDWCRFVGVTQIEDDTNPRGNSTDDDRRKVIHLLSQGNDVFASTNMGVVLSINAVTGHLNWVFDYSKGTLDRREKGDQSTEWSPSTSDSRGMKPPRIIKDSLYVLPWDSPFFLGFDLQTGTRTLRHAIPDATSFMDHGFLNMFKGKPTAIFTKKNQSEEHMTALPLTSGKIKEKNLGLSFSARPSVSPGINRFFLGGQKKLRSIRRENIFIKYDVSWPAKNKVDQFELIASGPHIILVGPGGIAVLTTGGAVFRSLAAERLRTGFPASPFPY